MADLPPGYTLARPHASDARAIQTLVNACESADCGEQREDDWEVASDLLDPAVDIARDWFLVRAPHGEPAGFGSAYCPPGAEPWTLAYVHPLHRGRLLSAVLLELAEQRVREHLAERATGQDDRVDPKTSTVLTICEDTKTQRIAWLCARRYRRVRDSYAMRIDLSRGFAGSEWPAGFELRQARLPADERASYEADLEAFVEHFGYYEQSFEAWKARHETHPEFDPALWLIAWSGSEIAGQVAGVRRGPAAYIDDVAVRKPWRGRGLALALLLEEFARFHARGCDDVYLFVDAENPTGAVRLYEKAGMKVWRRFGHYRLELGS
jgi:ribosomal protein S18 acetylase RimI-like enzyme